MNRRDVLRLLVVGGIAGLGVACATPAPSAPPPSPAATPVPQSPSAPRAGGTLRLGTLGDLVSLDGHASGPFDTLYQVWDLLGVEDEHLNLQPVLAESFDWSSDTRQLQFRLRKGVTWHTGRDFTSDDVRWNLERVRDPKVGGGILASYVKPLAAIDTPDKWTIVLKSNDAWPGVFDFIQHLNVIDPVTAQGPDGPNKPVGTGPFMVGEYAQGDHLRLVRNRSYWRADRPYLDEILFTFFKDPQSMAAQFEAGALDGVLSPTLRDTQRYQQDPSKFQVLLNRPAGDALMILCNCSVDQPITNNCVRR